jgi:hypothetical protein
MIFRFPGYHARWLRFLADVTSSCAFDNPYTRSLRFHALLAKAGFELELTRA